jgi:peptide/nickel transport system permease protein
VTPVYDAPPRVSFLAFLLRRLGAVLVTLLVAPLLTFAFFTTLRRDDYTLSQLPGALADYAERAYLHFEWGTDATTGVPLTRAILDGLPVDLALLVGGFALGLAAGVLAGIACARHARSPLDRALSTAAALLLSSPVYWMGFLVLVVFSPAGGYLPVAIVPRLQTYAPAFRDPVEWLHAMWVPTLVVAAPLGAAALRLTRGSLLETAGEDFVRTAYAKGLSPRRVVRRHVLPVAAPPVILYAGVSTNVLITNVALMESAFNLPGTFRELPQAVQRGDLEVLQGLVIFGAFLIVLTNLLADLVHAALDPRVRRGADR